MRKLIPLVATSMLAVAGLVPVTANAANDLRGAPTLSRIDAHHAHLRFTTDRRLALRRGSTSDMRIAFSGGARRVASIVATGRHGDDYVYTAHVSSTTELRTGTKYTVRFRFGGRAAMVRLVKLHDR